MTAMLRAIIIDPMKREVREERVPDTLDGFQAVVGGSIEPVAVECLGTDTIYCDEEGKQKPNYHFILRGREHDPFAGPCLIVGPPDREGNETETTWAAEEIAEHVQWLPSLDGEQLLV